MIHFPPHMRNRFNARPALLALVAACVFWGASFPFGKLALNELPVSHVVLYRFVLACLVLVPLALKSGVRPEKKDYPHFLLAGLLGVPVTLLLQFGGLALTSVTSAALIVGTGTPLLALGGVLFNRERLGRIGWGAVGASTLGVVLMVGFPGGAHSWMGDALVFLSMLAAVAWVLLSKRLMVRYPALVATAYMLGIGTLALVPIAVVWGGPLRLDLSWIGWGAMLALGFGCTALSDALWNWGLEQVEASRAGVYLNLEPLTGALLGITLFRDALDAGMVIGGVLILAAAWVIDRVPAPEPPAVNGAEAGTGRRPLFRPAEAEFAVETGKNCIP